MRASVAVEKLGYPSVSVVCDGFAIQGSTTAAGLGMPGLPMAAIPGNVDFQSTEELRKNVETVLVNRIVKGLTVPPRNAKSVSEPLPRDIIFRGKFEKVNKFFHDKEWSDGLPVIPPTVEKVGQFLKHTDRHSDEVIGVLLPDNREATIWNIAVNGVMAGCRPEHMPVLVAIVEAMADPAFGEEHLGQTPGTEVLITLNGPIIKELGFNYEQGALRVGFQANTSIGRFWRLYLRSVAGFLPHKTDKATFGGTWRVVLAENEDAVTRIGWEPMSVDQGFKAGDNVVTISSCTSTGSFAHVGAITAEKILDGLATRVVDVTIYSLGIIFRGRGVKPQVLISPCLAEAIAKGGYSKEQMRRYLYERAVFPAERFERIRQDLGSFCDAVRQGKLPKLYCESEDPNRLIPIVASPDDFMITVSGDPARDNCLICAQNGYIGYPVSKEIGLPANWLELLRAARDN